MIARSKTKPTKKLVEDRGHSPSTDPEAVTNTRWIPPFFVYTTQAQAAGSKFAFRNDRAGTLEFSIAFEEFENVLPPTACHRTGRIVFGTCQSPAAGEGRRSIHGGCDAFQG